MGLYGGRSRVALGSCARFGVSFGGFVCRFGVFGVGFGDLYIRIYVYIIYNVCA